MLIPSSRGFAVSVNKHNVELDALAEWIEGCVTFVDDRVSKTDVADLLIEENYYRTQDFANVRITDAWKELARREKCLSDACSFAVDGPRIERTKPWNQTPAYSFCLMLSLQVSYRPAFTDMFGTDYTEQGVLFERLTAEALQRMGWRTHTTGWSKQAADSIRDRVEALASHLGEPSRPNAVEKWTEQTAKDGGIDVVCHLPFPDRWSGRPLFYVQCASGENWKDKRHTPNLQLWDKLLDLATRPTRAISVPFTFLADDFRRAANFDLLSLILDRHRLCALLAATGKKWLSDTLGVDLSKWTESRLPALLKAEAK